MPVRRILEAPIYISHSQLLFADGMLLLGPVHACCHGDYPVNNVGRMGVLPYSAGLGLAWSKVHRP